MPSLNTKPASSDAIPEYVLRSNTYERFLATGDPEVTDDVRRRYDVLVDKRLSGAELTQEESDELDRIEMEMDASDFLAQPPDGEWRKAMEAKRQEVDRKLVDLESRINDLLNPCPP